MKDKEIERIWRKLEDIPFDENREQELVLAKDFYIFKKGTPRSYLWHWFDEKYPKGVAYLLNVRCRAIVI